MKTLRCALLSCAVLPLAYSLYAQSAPPAAPTPTPTPMRSSPAQTPSESDVTTLSAYEVNTSQDVGYRSVESTSGTLIAEQLKNLPQSISVFNQEFIQDTGATNLFELARYATGGESQNRNFDDTSFTFRGITTSWQTRDGFIWYLPQDNFSVERAEVVRGPNALLYGNAQPGGLVNIIAKRANIDKRQASIQTLIGSWDRYRFVGDVNVPLIKGKLAARVNLVYQQAHDWRDFRYEKIRGVQAGVTYRLGPKTVIRGTFEGAEVRRNQGQNLFVDQYSSYGGSGTTVGTGTIAAGSANIYYGGTLYSYTTNNRLSAGTGLVLSSPNPLPRNVQFTGPSPHQNRNYDQWMVTIEHELLPKLNLEATINRQDQQNLNFNDNSGTTTLRQDPNQLLPTGAANPNFNQYYVDNSFQIQNISNQVLDQRVAINYPVEIPSWGITQKLIAFWTNRVDYFTARTYNETLLSNLGVVLQHRHYVNNYSAEDLKYTPLPTISRFFGNGTFAQQRNELTSYSFATVGSYWHDRIHTLGGVRRDTWIPKTDTFLTQPSGTMASGAAQPVERIGFDGKYNPVTPLKRNSVNYGGVVDVVKDWHGLAVSGYWNYAESFQPNASFTRVDGTAGAPLRGRGKEFGVRLFGFSGRAVLSVVRYNINQVNAQVGVSQAVRDDVNKLFYTNPDGSLKNGSLIAGGGNGDTATQNSQGTEVELTLNPRSGWTLTANYAYNALRQKDTLPLIGPYFDQLQAQGVPVAQYANLNALVTSTRANSNLVTGNLRHRANMLTRYTFSNGFFRGTFVGAGVNYRGSAYQGLVSSVPYYSDPSKIFNFLGGYNGKWNNYRYTVQLNMDNVTNRYYYVAYGLGLGRWSNPREIRVTTTVKF